MEAITLSELRVVRFQSMKLEGSADQVFEIRFDDELTDLHERLRGLRARGPIAPVRFLGEDGWIILTHQAVHEALRDDVALPLRPYFEETVDPAVGRSLMSMEGDEHSRNR